MKPTKDQIMMIGAKIIKERIDLLQSCGLPKEEISERINVADIKDDIETAIIEWEKIKEKEKESQRENIKDIIEEVADYLRDIDLEFFTTDDIAADIVSRVLRL